MSGSLRDDLASLKIDRSGSRIAANGNSSKTRESAIGSKPTPQPQPQPQPRPQSESVPELESMVGRPRRRRRGFGMALLSMMLWLLPLSVLGAVGSYAYREYEKRRPKMEVQLVQAQRMTAAEAEKVLSAKGYLESRNQAMVGSMNPGRVENIMVEEGRKVKKGDVLAVLEHESLKALLDARKAMSDRSKAELLEAEATLEDKVRRESRASRLYERRSTSIDDLDDARVERKTAEARVQALKAAIRLMEAQVREAQESIRNMHVYAPFDGTILTKEAEIGETITPGGMGAASGRGAVVGMADLDRLEVEADVAENYLPRLKLGQPTEIAVSAVSDRRFRGRLRLITPMGDRTRATIKVKVEILDKDPRLFPELAATVHFLPLESQAVEKANVKPEVFVAKEALFEEAGKFYVWVFLQEKNQVRRQEVEVIVPNDGPARVEKGLNGDERVVLKPEPALTEGMLVKPAE